MTDMTDRSLPPVRVELRAVTETNWQDVLALSVRADQEEFVPSVAVSLAKAYIKPDGLQCDPFAIYAPSADDSHSAEKESGVFRPGSDVPVGFLLFLHAPHEPRKGYLDGFLIGETFQGRGYGSAALSAFLSLVGITYPSCRDLYLFVDPNNHAAQALYESQGFRRFRRFVPSQRGRIAYHFPRVC